MPGIEESLPLRCRGCHRFAKDILESQAIAAEIDIITASEEKLERHASDQGIRAYLAALALQKIEVDERIASNSVYTVGCPGLDMSDLVGSGIVARIGRCNSPLEQ